MSKCLSRVNHAILTSPTGVVVMAIFDKYIHEILANPVYLTEKNKTDLLTLFPARVQEANDAAKEPDVVNDGKPIPLRTYINKMLKSLETQQSNVLSSEDPRDHKMIFDGYGKIITMLMKHNETIDIQERAQKIEEAVVEALEKTAEEHSMPELKETFLKILNAED